MEDDALLFSVGKIMCEAEGVLFPMLWGGRREEV